jgi:hypothetical protein
MAGSGPKTVDGKIVLQAHMLDNSHRTLLGTRPPTLVPETIFARALILLPTSFSQWSPPARRATCAA